MGDMRNAHEILDGKPNVKRQLRKHTPRRENNIKMDLKETEL
jgi:hypothetical protein